MAQTTSSVLTEFYRYLYAPGRVRRFMNERMALKSKIDSLPDAELGGRGQFILPIEKDLPEGVYGNTEGGAIGTALAPSFTEATYSLQEIHSVLEVTWKAMSDSRNNKMAFGRAAKRGEKSLKLATLLDLNNMMLGDGRGVLASLPGADNTSPITVSRPIRARRGMVVDIMDTDNDTKHLDSGTISAVDYAANTITVSGSVSSTAASDYFVREDQADDSVNDALSLNGITGIVDTDNPASIVGNYGGINRSTAGNEFWESVVLANSGTNRSLTEDLILNAIHDARLQGGGETDMILTSPAVFRRYFELAAQDRFFTQDAKGKFSASLGPKDAVNKSKAGATGFDFGGIPIHIDDFAEANTLFGLDTSTFMWGHGINDVPQLIGDIFPEATSLRQTSNTSFEIVLWGAYELICDNPSGNWKVEDISES